MHKVYPFLLLFIQSVCSSNTLNVYSMPFRSYHMWNQKLALELVEREHNITFRRTYEEEIMETENYTEIIIERVYETIKNNTKTLLKKNSYSAARFILDFTYFCLLSCQTSTESPELSHLLNSYKDFKFDLIIFKLTGGSCFYPLMETFNYPSAIGVTQLPLLRAVAFNFGNQLNPAYIPFRNLSYDNEMSFPERVWNFILTYLELGMRCTYMYKQEHEIAQTVFGKNIPPMEDLERHILLILINTHPTLNYAKSLAPNVILVAGLHLTRSKKLPQDLQKILDGAKNSAIVFSLGTMVIWKELTQIRENLLDVFSQIPETVLLKYDGDIENVPKNVIVRKWLPQSDVLGHPNVKLLIGHGGALSSQEALYHRVPILCIPFYRDQHHTADIIARRQLGVSLSLQEIESNLVLQKLEEVLRNLIYSGNMKRASRMFRNSKETSLERAVFWVEYLLEYGDVDFLSTSARDLPFYKSSSLDVLIFMIFVLIVLIMFFYESMQYTLTVLTRKSKVKLNWSIF